MHKETRDIIVLGLAILGWGALLWLMDKADHADWLHSFATDKPLSFARLRRDDMIAEEFEASDGTD